MENKKYLIQHVEGGYLHRWPDCRWTRVPDKEKATRLTYEKAENVLKNSISSVMRCYWTIVVDDDPTVPVCTKTQSETEPFNWQELSQTQQKLFGDLKLYGEDLRNNLSQVDQEICDIQHYIEFFTLDAAKGYKAYRMLKERLNRRRQIKDEMAKINYFLSGTASDFASGKVTQQIKEMDQRIYTPRVLEELFGSAPLKGKVA